MAGVVMKHTLFVSAPSHPRGWWGVRTFHTNKQAVDAARSVFNGETWLPDFCIRDVVKIVSGSGDSYLSKTSEDIL